MYLAEMAESASPVRSEKAQKAFSCLRCFERKVKCDKSHPCANCVKASVDCHFRIPSAPKRKRKRGTEEILLERLKRAEDLLRSKGLTATSTNSGSDSIPSTEVGPSPQQPLLDNLTPQTVAETGQAGRDPVSFLNKPPFSSGKLIQNEGRARFIDNNLWSSLSEEFHPKDAIDEYSSDDDDEQLADESSEFVLGLTPNSNAMQHLHPTTNNIFKLWQVFLENFNPMTKIVHYPSLQEQLVKASTDLENVPRGLEVMMFTIYNCAVSSLDEGECEKIFGEARKSLLSRYRHGTRRALARAKFLGTADLMVLQAFVLYVLAIRPESDARTVWALAGLANRIAQSMGVHRDGKALGVPPFETEMRRRLWWQITILDFRSAELTGSGRFGDMSLSDTGVPTNVNDPDIWPGMTEAPIDKARPTEMVACLLRCEFGSFWKEKLLQKTTGKGGDPINDLSNELANIRTSSALKDISLWEASTEERDRHIDELERRLEEKFLRYCEPQIPIQFMASLVGRGAIASMRLMAHHPRRWKDESLIPDSERALLWGISIKMLEGDSFAHTTKSMKRFMWHTKVYFQWQALIYILSQLKTRTTGEEVDEAWGHINDIYDNHTEFVIEWKKPLHVAVGGLCLKAWDARLKGRQEAQEQGDFMLPLQTPDYIEMLRQHKLMTKRRSERTTSTPTLSPPQAQTTPNGSLIVPKQSSNTSQSQNPTPLQSEASMMWEPGINQGSFDFNAMSTNPSAQFYYNPSMMNMDPTLATGGTGNERSMDWTQWDYLLQDFEMNNTNPRYGSGGGVRM